MNSQKPPPTNEEGCYCKVNWRIKNMDPEGPPFLSYLSFAPGRFRIQRIRRKDDQNETYNMDFSFIAVWYPRWLRYVIGLFPIRVLSHFEVAEWDVECTQQAPYHLISIKLQTFKLEVEITDPSFQWSRFAQVVFREEMFSQQNNS